MTTFNEQLCDFWKMFENGKKMVLSTSLDDYVTSRMMSIIQMDGFLYFQTDKTFRKYEQLIKNRRVALCIDNIQIEGICEELGRPLENEAFVQNYKLYFASSFERYTQLENERMFKVTPQYIKLWIYEEGKPFEKIFDIQRQKFDFIEYKGNGNL